MTRHGWAALAAARKRGVKVGRPRSLMPAQVKHAQKLLRSGETRSAVAKSLGDHRSTLYRRSILHSIPNEAISHMYTRKILSIEALRGFASVSVALFHFSGQMTTSIPQIIHAYGWLGVDIFFVISGFVIPLSLMGRDYHVAQFPSFMARRLVRLEPPYIASIILGIVLWHASTLAPGFQGDAPTYSISQIAFHLFYLIPLTDYSWLNPVFWTLAYEFVFYILVGLTFPFLISRPVEYTAAFGLAILGAKYFSSSALDVKVLEFLFGTLLMRLTVESNQKTKTFVILVLCLILIFMLGGPKIGVAVLIAAVVIAAFRNFKLGKWAIFLGAISYSLYLTHVPVGGRVINLGRRFGSGASYEVLLLCAALATSLIFAWLFYHLIEKPALKASRQIVLAP